MQFPVFLLFQSFIAKLFLLVIIIKLVSTMNLIQSANNGGFLAKSMKQAAIERLPFTDSDIERVVTSFQNLSPASTLLLDSVDWNALRQFVTTFAHGSHKDWARTDM